MSDLDKLGYMMTVGAVLDHKNKKPPEQPKKKWMGTWPADCDICKIDLSTEEYFVDGRTQVGPWALMCMYCFGWYGAGLGTGFGQKYLVKTKEKVEG